MQREMFPTDRPSKFDQSLMDAYSSIHEGARKGHAAGDSDVEKQASQLASDVRYKAKGKLKPGASKEQMMKVYMAVLASSPAPSAVKTLAKKKILGEQVETQTQIPPHGDSFRPGSVKNPPAPELPPAPDSKRKKKPKAQTEELDPVGQRDGDVNDDGKKDKTDEYIYNRRDAIKRAIAKKREKSGKKVSEGYTSWRMDLNYFEEEGKK